MQTLTTLRKSLRSDSYSDLKQSAITAMVIPLVKLGTLAIRTISKPIANRLKQEASINPKFRTRIIAIAQANHRFTTNMQRRIYGRATDVAIRPLNEERAVQVASDLIGELFVFSVAGAAVIFEWQRSSRSEARKEEMRKQELQEMKQRHDDLVRDVEALKHDIEVMRQELAKGGLGRILSYLRHIQNVEDRQQSPPDHHIIRKSATEKS